MNIKSIKNNYHLLSMQERAALVFAAAVRGDEQELEAINAATPRVGYNIADFYFLAHSINQAHILNIFERWNQQVMFDTFLDIAEDLSDEKKTRVENLANLSAYLYVIETDAWELVGSEYSLDVPAYRRHLADKLMCVSHLEMWDELMRRRAFTKDEALKFLFTDKIQLKIHTGNKKIVEFKTLESVAEQYRNLLSETQS